MHKQPGFHMRLWRRLTSKIDVHTIEVIKKSSASLLVKIGGMVVGLLVSIFLGRALGAEGLGIINLANKIVIFLLVFTMFGMDHVIIKRVAIDHERKNPKGIAGTMFTSFWINVAIALVLSFVLILVAYPISLDIFHSENLYIPLVIALAMIIPQTISRIYAAGLIGIRKVWQSNLVNQTLTMWSVGLGILVLFLFGIEITIINVAILYGISRIVTMVSVTGYWKKFFKYKGPREWQGKPMFNMALPLLLVMATVIISESADTIMLGWLSNPEEVGLYSVAARLALLVSFFLQVSNSAISPKLASLFADKRIDEMEKMVKRVTGGLILIAVASLLIFIFGGKLILSLWGSEFTEAYLVLVILGIGQFFNISTGCAGLLLIMCGHEKVHSRISLVSIILNLVLNYFLILNYGAVGAAIATAITVGLENVIKLTLAKMKVGVLTLPISIRTKKNS